MNTGRSAILQAAGSSAMTALATSAGVAETDSFCIAGNRLS